MYSLSLASYARSKFLQIGQCMRAPFRRSAGPTVASIRSWFKLREVSIKVAYSQGGRREGERAYNFEDTPTITNVPTAPSFVVLDGP
jgi:hypothetical protein